MLELSKSWYTGIQNYYITSLLSNTYFFWIQNNIVINKCKKK